MLNPYRHFIFVALIAFIIFGLIPSKLAQQSGSSSTSNQTQNSSQKPASQTRTPEQQNQDLVVRISTQLVQVDAVVTDKKGKHVEDLTVEDFELLVDGKKQELTHFTHVNLPPVKRESLPVKKTTAPVVSEAMPTRQIEPREVRRTIAFIVDDLGLSFTSTERVRETLRKFLNEQMQEGDLVAIIRTGNGLGMLEQFTSDKRILFSAIEKLVWNPLSRDMIPSFGDTGGLADSEESQENAAAQQTIDDSINSFRDTLFSTGTLGAINFVVRGLRDLPGRKSVILLSDGFNIYPPNNSNDPQAVAESQQIQSNLKQLVELSNRSSVVVYSIDARGLMPLVPGADAGGKQSGDAYARAMQENQEALEGPSYLANQTGGFAVFNNNDLNFGVNEALYDQQSYYLLGFDPEDEKFDRQHHRIKVVVKRPGLRVRARSGFYGIGDEDAHEAPKSRAQQIFAGLLSPLGVRELSLKMTPYFFNSAKEGSLVRTLFHIDGSRLTFKDGDGGRKQINLDLAAYAFDDKGTPIDLNARHIVLDFDETQYQRVLAEGLTYRSDFPIKKPGAYQFRAVLRDAETGRLGTASQFIQVPDLIKNKLAMSGLVLTVPKTGETIAPAAKVSQPTDLRTTPYIRSFPNVGLVQYGAAIYNAATDKKTGQPQLTVQVEIYRDGKLFRQLPAKAIEFPAKANAKRFDMVGQLELKNFPAGDFLLRVVVTDALAKKKNGRVEQWMDFTVR